jgi:hypothetical protein
MLASLLVLHVGWSWIVIVGNGMAGLWALGALRWWGLRTRALWWFTAVAEVAMLAQVVSGVVLVAGQNIPVPRFHMFYGFVALLTIGLLYSYRQQARARIHLLYGLGGLFLMGLGIRAMLVGARG